MNCIKEVENKNMTRTGKVIFFISLLVSGCAHKGQEVDLIIHNAKIYTIDASNNIFEAIAISDGIIIELGPEHQILNKYKAKKIIDAQMKPIYPGFIDAHCHFIGYGLALQNINLVGTKSFNEVLTKVKEYKIDPNQPWIQGGGWDQNDWKDKTYPNKKKLDSIFPNTPIILRRIDGHAAIVNQKALDLANISVDTKLENGEILKENGRLTGVLIDGAVEKVTEIIPESTNSLKAKAILQAQQNCFSVGLTTVDDCGISKSEVFLLDSLHKSGELKLRVYAMLKDSKENFDYFLESGPFYTDKLSVNSFKFYADGSLGSRGAAMLTPYADLPDHLGYMMNSKDYYLKMGQKVYDKGFQMNTHCIGDSANRLILDVYSSILKGPNDKKWRIEHAQVINPEDLSKFKDFSIIPSVQPTHATSDMYWVAERLGAKRVKLAYAYNDLKEQLGLIALGTDFPVEKINPLFSFYSSVYRKDKKGFPVEGFQVENALTRKEALKGMTIWAAIANNEYETKGTLEKGKFADLIILDRDILEVPESYLLETKVLYTIVAGDIVFQD